MLAKHILIGLISGLLVSGTIVLENQHGKPVQVKTREIVDVIERVKARGPHAAGEEEGNLIAQMSDSLKFAPRLRKEQTEYLQFPLENVSYYLVTANEGKALQEISTAQERFRKLRPQIDEELQNDIWALLENTRYELEHMIISPTVVRAQDVVAEMLFELYVPDGENRTYYENLLSHRIKSLPKLYDALGGEAGAVIAAEIERFGEFEKKIQKTDIEKELDSLYELVMSTPELANVATVRNITTIRKPEKKRAIGLLYNVKKLLEEGKITVRTGQELNTFFIQETEVDRSELEKTDGELFEFLEFLDNAQYTSLPDGVVENFTQFKRDRKHAADILEFVDELKRKDTAGEKRDILTEVRMDFERARAKNIQIEIIGEGENPAAHVSGEVSKIAFSGTYNVNRKVITDLEVNEDSISQAVPLAELRALLLKKFGAGQKTTESSETPEKVSPESDRQEASKSDIAISVVWGELKKLGIEVGKEEIEIVDVDEGIFKVATPLVKFTVHKKENKVTDLEVNSAIGEILVNGDVMFAELKKRIDSIMQIAEES